MAVIDGQGRIVDAPLPAGSSVPSLLGAITLSALGLGLVVLLAGLEIRTLVPLLLGISAAPFYFLALDARQRIHLALFALALTVPFFIDKNFGYQSHVGGASNLSLSDADLAVFTLALLLLYESVRRGERRLFRVSGLVISGPLIFMAIGLASLINADRPPLVFFELVRLVKLTLLALVVMNVRSEAALRVLVSGLCIGVLLQGGLAVAQYASGSSLGLGFFGEESPVEQQIGYTVSRAGGTLGHPNVLAYYLEILLPVVLALFLGSRGARTRSAYLAVFAAGFVGLLMTLSRGAWMTLPLSIAVVFLVMRGRQLASLRGLLGIFLAVGALGLAVGAMHETIQRRLLRDDYKSAESRIPLNQATLSIIWQKPLLGIGLNNFAESFQKYDTTTKARIFHGYQHVVHNLHLWVAAEVGILGYVAFLWIFAGAFLAGIRARRRAPPWASQVLLGAMTGLVAHLVHGFVDPGFPLMTNISVLVYLMLGLIGAIAIVERERADAAAGREAYRSQGTRR